MKSAVRFGLALITAIVVLLPARAEAETYTFSTCFDNNSGVCSELASQLLVEVTQSADGYVEFTFTNEIGIKSSITDIYFDADGYLSNMVISGYSDGVSFTAGSGSPSLPPGGSDATPPFVVTSSLLADSDSPKVAKNGINSADEYLTLQFQITDNQSFAQIIAAIEEGINEGDGIRIAAHVQAIGSNGESDTFICCTGGGTPSPEPASMALFGLLAVGAAYRLRRRGSAEAGPTT